MKTPAIKDKKDKITEKFIQHLSELGISKKSHKNYRSDLSHFTGWLLFKVRQWGLYADNLTEATPFLTPKLADEYKKYLLQNKSSPRTINRRLSTLRHLAKFLQLNDILAFDFTEGVSNISLGIKSNSTHPLIIQFKEHLEAERVSKNTIKNYLADIKQFISWLETHPEKN